MTLKVMVHDGITLSELHTRLGVLLVVFRYNIVISLLSIMNHKKFVSLDVREINEMRWLMSHSRRKKHTQRQSYFMQDNCQQWEEFPFKIPGHLPLSLHQNPTLPSLYPVASGNYSTRQSSLKYNISVLFYISVSIRFYIKRFYTNKIIKSQKDNEVNTLVIIFNIIITVKHENLIVYTVLHLKRKQASSLRKTNGEEAQEKFSPGISCGEQ